MTEGLHDGNLFSFLCRTVPVDFYFGSSRRHFFFFFFPLSLSVCFEGLTSAFASGLLNTLQVI